MLRVAYRYKLSIYIYIYIYIYGPPVVNKVSFPVCSRILYHPVIAVIKFHLNVNTDDNKFKAFDTDHI